MNICSGKTSDLDRINSIKGLTDPKSLFMVLKLINHKNPASTHLW